MPRLIATVCTIWVLLGGFAFGADSSFSLPSGLGDSSTRTVAAHDDLIVVAGTQNDTSGGNYGYACVFKRNANGAFTHQQTLRADDAAANSLFGHAVAVAPDLIVVSAIGDGSFEGAVYLFEFDSGSWSQTAKLTASTGESMDFFGGSVDCSEDRIAIGAWGDDTNGAVSGAVYVFDRDSNDWSETATLTASDASQGHAFGKSVATSGTAVVVGAPDKNQHAGAVYVFRESAGSWSEEATLTAGASGDFFGTSVGVDIDVVAVGAPSADTPLKDSGSVYVFTKSGSTWSQPQQLTAAQASGDALGHDVSLKGSTLAASAPATTGGGTGCPSIVVWTQSSPSSSWTEDRRCTLTAGGSTNGLANDDLVASPSTTATSASTFDLN